MSATDPLTVEVVSVRLPEALLLMARLTEELARRYSDDGVGGFRPEDVEVPGSGFVLARWDGRAAACGAFRPLTGELAEIKRMYVEPDCRGRGIGRRILLALEDEARRAGYAKVRLETGTAQPEALGLYEAAGYYRIDPYGFYRDDPRSVSFEKVIV